MKMLWQSICIFEVILFSIVLCKIIDLKQSPTWTHLIIVIFLLAWIGNTLHAFKPKEK